MIKRHERNYRVLPVDGGSGSADPLEQLLQMSDQDVPYESSQIPHKNLKPRSIVIL